MFLNNLDEDILILLVALLLSNSKADLRMILFRYLELVSFFNFRRRQIRNQMSFASYKRCHFRWQINTFYFDIHFGYICRCGYTLWIIWDQFLFFLRLRARWLDWCRTRMTVCCIRNTIKYCCTGVTFFDYFCYLSDGLTQWKMKSFQSFQLKENKDSIINVARYYLFSGNKTPEASRLCPNSGLINKVEILFRSINNIE